MDYIVKPFDVKDLKQRLKKYLKNLKKIFFLVEFVQQNLLKGFYIKYILLIGLICSDCKIRLLL